MNTSIRLIATAFITLAFTCNTAKAQETANVNNDFAYLADSNVSAVSSTGKSETSAYTEAIERVHSGEQYF